MVIDDRTYEGRFVKYNNKSGTIELYNSTFKENLQFRIGYINNRRTVEEGMELCEMVSVSHGMELCEMVSVSHVENFFVYSCIFRRTYMCNAAKWEISPFARYNISGMFTMGEILHVEGRNCFYHGAAVFTGIAEKDSFVLPDLSVFDDTSMLDKDNELLKLIVDKTKGCSVLAEGGVVQKIVSIQKEQETVTSVDDQTGLPNILQYKRDKKIYNYDKMCLMHIMTSDIVIAHMGYDQYYETLRDIVDSVTKKLSFATKDITLYSANYNTLFFVARADTTEVYFRTVVSQIYNSFHLSTYTKMGISSILRFVLVLNQSDMLESGLNTLHATQNHQSNMIVCDRPSDTKVDYTDELEVIELLNDAILSRNIKPYYQGIHNNKQNEIRKYEALMRLIDSNGTVYTPAKFMDIAKKYHLYTKLSSMMIDRVLEDFADVEEEVSINLSTYDIESEEFRDWFFHKAKEFKNPSRLTIELVETENHDNAVVTDYIKKLRTLGVKLAIDDFGTGYSTFYQIVRLKPDYIKIDGSIIKNITTDLDELSVLEAIAFLSRKINAETVAEFVENQEVQSVLERYAIDFSQGYYFSKPSPVDQIEFHTTDTGLIGVPTKKFEFLYNSSPIGIIVVNKDLTLRSANDYMFSLFDLKRCDVVGRKIGDVFGCSVVHRTGLQCDIPKECIKCRIVRDIERIAQDGGSFTNRVVDHEFYIGGLDYRKWFMFSANRIAEEDDTYTIVSFIDITRQKEYEQLLQAKLSLDLATGTLNKSTLISTLKNLANAGGTVSIAMIDFDNFKGINDTYGHTVGDMVIGAFSKAALGCLRGSDIVARFGGEEFVLVLFNESVDISFSVLQRIYNSFRITCLQECELSVTFSAGVREFSEVEIKSMPIDGILQSIDDLLYDAKRSGKNRVYAHGGKVYSAGVREFSEVEIKSMPIDGILQSIDDLLYDAKRSGKNRVYAHGGKVYHFVE